MFIQDIGSGLASIRIPDPDSLQQHRNPSPKILPPPQLDETSQLGTFLPSTVRMCQVIEHYLSCTHTQRYSLVNSCPFGFCTDVSSCKGNNNQIIANRLIYTPLWCGPCFHQRHDTILAVHQLYANEIYAQAECEGWSNSAIEQAIRRHFQQEDKEIQSFLAAVEETESRNARLHGVRRRQHGWDSDEEEYEGDSEDNEDDTDGSDSEGERVSNLVTRSCEQRNYIDLDDESSGSDSEGPLGRVLICESFGAASDVGDPIEASRGGSLSHRQRLPGRVLLL